MRGSPPDDLLPRGHLNEEHLERLLRGALAPDDAFESAFHLSLCGPCRGRLLGAWPLEGRNWLRRVFPSTPLSEFPDLSDPDLDAARLHAAAVRGLLEGYRRVIPERQAAPEHARKLLGMPAGRRRLVLANARGVATLGLAHYCLESAEGLWHDDPDRALELSEMAADAASRIEAEPSIDELAADYRAHAWAYVANAHRIKGDLRAADQAMTRARQAVADGTQDVLLEARLAELESSLRRDQRRFDEAIDLATTAAEGYRTVRDVPGESRAVVKEAIALGLAQHHDEAVARLEGLLARVGRAEMSEPVYLCAAQCLATELVDAGHVLRARSIFPELVRLVSHGGELDRLRVLWLEGTIAAACGQHEQAEGLLTQARDAYLKRGHGYDAAVVTLHLAALYLDEGSLPRVRELAREVGPVFESLGIHREALAALQLFWESATRDRATVELARQVLRYLKLARHDPSYAFSPPH